MRVPRRYRAGQQRKRKGRGWFKTASISLVILAVLGGVVLWDAQRGMQTGEVIGVSRSVAQKEDTAAITNQLIIDEPFFAMMLAPGWKEIERRNVHNETSITWQSKVKNNDNRWLKLYIDVIPPNIAINKLLPIDVVGPTLKHRQLSANCKEFTVSTERNIADKLSKWGDIEFVCDLPNYVQNKTGTGTEGSINSTEVTGSTKGTHKYFFVYTDHNAQPDYTSFYNSLMTFQA